MQLYSKANAEPSEQPRVARETRGGPALGRPPKRSLSQTAQTGSDRGSHGIFRMAYKGWHAISVLFLAAGIGPAAAGPPYQSDDPQPTDLGHFELYTFNKGTFGRSGSSSASGLDFNYGAAPDLQLTAVVPFGYDAPSAGPSAFGPGNIELAAKYKVIHQETFGLDVSVFPRVFLPSPSQTGNPYASILLPIWVQKDWGSVSAFGGGGCQFSLQDVLKDFCLYGATVTRQVFAEPATWFRGLSSDLGWKWGSPFNHSGNRCAV
jgi:hypothetical protein